MSVDLDRGAKPFSAGLAALLVGAVGFVAAATRGVEVAGLAVLALAGTAVFVRGVTIATAATDGTTNREWALASVALGVGMLLAVVPLFRLEPLAAGLVYPFVLAAGFAGVGSTSALVEERVARVRELCWRSRDVLGLATAVSLLVHTGVLEWGVLDPAVAVATLATPNTLVSLLVLEGLVVALLLALPSAHRRLQEVGAAQESGPIASVTVDGRPVGDLLPAIPHKLRGYWWVLALQLLPVVLAPNLLDAALARVPVFGPALAGLLTGGLLHLAVGGLVSAAVAVIALSEVGYVVRWWAEVDPPRVLAAATGGVVLSAAVLVPGHLLADPVTEVLFGGTELARLASVYGPAALVLGALTTVTFLLPFALVFAGLPVSMSRVATERSSAFGVAAVLGLSGSVVAAAVGVPTVVVFAGVAASLLTWELGQQASYLGTQVGSAVETRQPEIVHATAAVAVGVAGIVLASLAGYLLVPIEVPGGSDRASVALMLALVATVSFVLALQYRPSS